MTTVVSILFAIIAVLLILVVLLQAGKGGGMGVALGGGATQSVFGGSGGADFLAKLTYGLAAGFMVCALYLAYASAHTGSARLQEESERFSAEENIVDEEGEVNYERIGPNPLPLPPPGTAPSPVPGDGEPTTDDATAPSGETDPTTSDSAHESQADDATAAGKFAAPTEPPAPEDTDG
jgi:preprotein translocase subunit SecG